MGETRERKLRTSAFVATGRSDDAGVFIYAEMMEKEAARWQRRANSLMRRIDRINRGDE